MTPFGVRVLILVLYALCVMVVVPALLVGTPFIVRLAVFVPCYLGVVGGLLRLLNPPTERP